MEKETTIRRIVKEKKESKEKKEPLIVRYKAGNVINKGDWVKVKTSGKFIRGEGTVLFFKKWIAFEDLAGVNRLEHHRIW